MSKKIKNRIIFFSGGASSFAVADFIKKKYPKDNIVLYFTDTLWEDGDLYRFIKEGSDKLELPLLTHSVGLTPPQLMVFEKFLFNSRVGICSQKLKMKVSMDYFKRCIEPPISYWHNKMYLKSIDIRQDAILYFGIGYDEFHRTDAIKKNWAPFQVDFPLITYLIDPMEILRKWSISIPRLYLLGFNHNNCGGRCVKAGQSHFKNLLEKDRETFIKLMEQEIVISEYIRYTKQPSINNTNDYLFIDVLEFVTSGFKTQKIKQILTSNKYIKNWCYGENAKGETIKKPYSFNKAKTLYNIFLSPQQCSLFEYGGCGCFVDFD